MNPDYQPSRLLDAVLIHMKLKNDAALSLLLEVRPSLISKTRHRRIPVGSALLLRLHDATGISVKRLRELLGDRRSKHRLSSAYGRPKVRRHEGDPQESIASAVQDIPAA